MQTITFTCETITPMFLSGADGQTPELRAPSIKGALRFWWRAMMGHLDLKTLKEREDAIFGSPDDKNGRSLVTVQIIYKQLQTESASLVPHKNMFQKSFKTQQTFDVVLGLSSDDKGNIYFKDCKKKDEIIFTFDKLRSLFEITCLLGGFGKRSRRGMGGVKIMQYCIDEQDVIKYKQPQTLMDIAAKLSVITPFFASQGNFITNTYNGNMELYGWLAQIEIGKPNKDVKAVLQKISDTTHELHQKDEQNRNYQYGASLGQASGGRFASPIYVSIVKTENGEYAPIITSLNTVPAEQNQRNISLRLQEEFKRNILR